MDKKFQFIDKLTSKFKEIFPDGIKTDNFIYSIEVIDLFNQLTIKEKDIILKNFYNHFLLIDNHNSLLEEEKNKIFSSKDTHTNNFSLSLFGEHLPLKVLFNHIEGNDRKYCWTILKLLIKVLEPPPQEKVINKTLGIEVDKNTNRMINDIVHSVTHKTKHMKGNPLTSIFDIANELAGKYESDVKSGNINLQNVVDQLEKNNPFVKNIISKLKPKETEPKEIIVIDENFSTDNIQLGEDKEEDSGINPVQIMKLMNDIKNSEIGDLLNTLPTINENTKPEDLLKIKQQMDKLMINKFNINPSEVIEQIDDKSIMDDEINKLVN